MPSRVPVELVLGADEASQVKPSQFKSNRRGSALTRRRCVGQLSSGGRQALRTTTYLFGQVTTGASNDLQQVRNIARRMVTQWGFSKEKLGAVAWEGPNGADPFRNPGASESREVQIDEEVPPEG